MSPLLYTFRVEPQVEAWPLTWLHLRFLAYDHPLVAGGRMSDRCRIDSISTRYIHLLINYLSLLLTRNYPIPDTYAYVFWGLCHTAVHTCASFVKSRLSIKQQSIRIVDFRTFL